MTGKSSEYSSRFFQTSCVLLERFASDEIIFNVADGKFYKWPFILAQKAKR